MKLVPVAWLVAFVAVASACGGDPTGSLERVAHPAGLATTSWRLIGVGERSLPPDPVVTLVFTETEVSGSGGCNGFGGTYTYDPASGELRIARLVSTKLACVGAVRNELEAAYFATLRGPLTATTDEAGRLVLIGQDATLRFEVGPQQGAPPAS